MQTSQPKNFRQICKNRNLIQKLSKQTNNKSCYNSKQPLKIKQPHLFYKLEVNRSPSVMVIRQQQKESKVEMFIVDYSDLSFQKIGSNQKFLSPSGKVKNQTESGKQQNSGPKHGSNSFKSIVSSKTSVLNAFNSNKKMKEQASINQIQQENLFNFNIPSIQKKNSNICNIKQNNNFLNNQNQGNLFKNFKKHSQTFKDIFDKKINQVYDDQNNSKIINANLIKAETSRKSPFDLSRNRIQNRLQRANEGHLSKDRNYVIKNKSYADSQRQVFTTRKYDQQISLAKIKEKERLIGLKKNFSTKQGDKVIQMQRNSRVAKSNSCLRFINKPLARKNSQFQKIEQIQSLQNGSMDQNLENKFKRQQKRIQIIKEESRTSFNSDFVNQSIQSHNASDLDMNPDL